MGKPPKPLTIFVDLALGDQPWIQVLRDKGHLVLHQNYEGADLILGPTCARFIPGMEKFLESFIRGARAVRYPGKKDD